MRRLHPRKRCQSDIDNSPKNPYISIKEACEMLYMTDSGVRGWIIRGKLKAFKSGGKWWVRKSDVETHQNILKITGRDTPPE